MSKMRRIFKRDDGFTLVELMVSFGILAVLVLMTALIIRASGTTYTAISQDINLQYESQTALSQLQEYVIDCNSTLAVKGDHLSRDELYIYDVKSDGTYNTYKFAVSSSGELQLYANHNAPGSYDFSGAEPQPMSSYVTGFAAEISPDGKAVTLRISYKLGTKEYEGTQTVAFRNAVTTSVVK